MQDNYYFICEAEDTIMEQELDDYEAEEQFVLEFVAPKHAIETNEKANHREKEETQTFKGMLERENRVLELVKNEIKFQ